MYRNGQVVSNNLLANTPGITSFGEDEAGEVYVVTTSGALFQFEPSGAQPPAFPTLLSETGIFTDTAAMITQDYGLEYFPKTYFIDKSGHVYSALVSALDTAEITLLVRAMGQG